jgi:hypothetical protein
MELPTTIREAITGIFLRPAWGLYDTIKGDDFDNPVKKALE